MKVKWSFLARAAEISMDGTLSIFGGDLQKIRTSNVPVEFSMVAIVTKFEYENEESTQESMHVRLSMVDPDGEELLEDEEGQEIGLEAPTENVDGNSSFTLILEMTNFRFSTFGVYRLTMSYETEGEEKKSINYTLNVLPQIED